MSKEKDTAPKWQPLATAKFTGDGNPVVNIDAGLVKGRLFLATGGSIENSTIPLWKGIEVDTTGWPAAPAELPTH